MTGSTFALTTSIVYRDSSTGAATQLSICDALVADQALLPNSASSHSSTRLRPSHGNESFSFSSFHPRSPTSNLHLYQVFILHAHQRPSLGFTLHIFNRLASRLILHLSDITGILVIDLSALLFRSKPQIEMLIASRWSYGHVKLGVDQVRRPTPYDSQFSILDSTVFVSQPRRLYFNFFHIW